MNGYSGKRRTRDFRWIEHSVSAWPSAITRWGTAHKLNRAVPDASVPTDLGLDKKFERFKWIIDNPSCTWKFIA